MDNILIVVIGIVVSLALFSGLILVFTSSAMVLREILNLHKKRRW